MSNEDLRTLTPEAPHKKMYDHVYVIDPYMYLAPDMSKICLVKSEKTALIDLSTSYTADKIVEGFKAIEQPIENVDYLFITHNHYDHCGCISQVVPQMPKVEVFGSDETRATIKNPGYKYSSTLFLYTRPCWDMAGSFKPLIGKDVNNVAPNDTFDLGDGVKIRVVDLPGHEVGNFGYFEEKTKTLFAGDSFGVYYGYYQPAAFKNCFSYFDFERSLERTLAMDFDHLFLSHGGYFNREKGKELLRMALKKAKNWKEVVEKLAIEEPSLEYILPKVLKTDLMPWDTMKEFYPESLFRSGIHSIILAYTDSLGIEVPAELTEEGWVTP